MPKKKKDVEYTGVYIASYWKKIIVIALFSYVALFFTQEIIFVNADLGRHIKNGELLINEGNFPEGNYYSYTEPDYSVVNHHWGSGVVFYLVNRAFEFKGLSVFYVLISLAGFGFFIKSTVERSGFIPALVCAVFSVGLITMRTEIRPEAFSYLLLGVFYYLLQRFSADQLSQKVIMAILIVLQLLWVNLHLFFVFGWLVIGAFWLQALVEGQRNKSSFLIKLLLATIVISLVNPAGYNGVLEPFMILREYGYMIAENQSIFFLHERFPSNMNYLHFEVTAIVIILLGFWVLKRKWRCQLANTVLIVFFLLLSIKAIRGIPMFGLMLIPVGGSFLKEVVDRLIHKAKRNLQRLLVFVSVLVIIVGGATKENNNYSNLRNYLAARNQLTGIGLMDNVDASAQFLKQNGIKGPVFNNYDIGGYFIYYLFPEHQVFVDNRPEAYSVDFFKKTYEPMQEHEEKWKEISNHYEFNCIYFFRLDNTPHAQPFLIRRIQDPEWAPVYVDGVTIILLKRNQENAEIIRQFELPQSMFVSTPT